MKVLLVGSGAREHALAWKLKESEVVSELLIWPGSVAMESLGEVFAPEEMTWAELANKAKQEDVDFVVVGPEKPLAEGFSDRCWELNLPIFGPKQAAACLESSKEFAKTMMDSAGIPTAAFKVVRDYEAALDEAQKMLSETGGVVIKASGLAAGKGVFVCRTNDEIVEGLARLKSSMASASETIVLEQILEGRECSFFCFVGKGGATPLGFAVDFKRLLDGDNGPNTGGMGCYTPVNWLPNDASRRVMELIVNPLLSELGEQGIDYTGCLYVGLMWGDEGPKVVEFNVRLGDPEAQVLALQDSRDWGALIAEKLGLLEKDKMRGTQSGDRYTVAVVLASEGYPFDKPQAKVDALPADLFLNQSDSQAIFGASVSKRGSRYFREQVVS